MRFSIVFLLLMVLLGCYLPYHNTRVIIDTDTNTLYLYRGLLVEMKCPVATGMVEPVTINNRLYHFETPKGLFTVWQVAENPVWIPPEWYYEKGIAPPIKDRPRIKGKLGDYALYLTSPGIMLHGTTEPDSIGKYATHGCVRLRKEDLKYIYERCGKGTKVLIY